MVRKPCVAVTYSLNTEFWTGQIFFYDSKYKMSGLMNILLIGRGGRESALALSSPSLLRLEGFSWLQVTGAQQQASIDKVSDIDGTSEDGFPGLVQRARDMSIDLDQSSAVVIVSAGGYPGKYAGDDKINMGHRHSVKENGDLVTAGGRVIAVSAACLAYQGVASIKFKNMHYRKDIAYRSGRENPDFVTAVFGESTGKQMFV
ncbi:bifunctional purine biosynthetic protein ADE1 [Drepanopeziza brunnea f. sp. 'multigermtubi' MB_m1]|uniref:Glycinamide ribonucleotide synthetase n=1 Tax=Marssonina brunnea f. sp. multigermtubi (strain MB_m1) TaxID=1072389 RepID=K1WAH8_MARBU|nr:bifunctional purine biosynthetic protein ADE1 [Drepanopeziza brunnea f. sp. 'multigermtubi' MB_m1]EKD14275.1 bifunctional purine biosynthetic protein ADE1 [Drepanopeziza brunnea f. sp. 'multigermtubi' MB_m1]